MALTKNDANTWYAENKHIQKPTQAFIVFKFFRKSERGAYLRIY